MDTLLIILVLGAIALGVAVWIARRSKPARPPEQQMDQDTAWNDPVKPADTSSNETPKS
jgi:hypothetical protein